jgi:hypothetical protein
MTDHPADLAVDELEVEQEALHVVLEQEGVVESARAGQAVDGARVPAPRGEVLPGSVR